jgi:membrane peptidoglycan carboxypeptidase
VGDRRFGGSGIAQQLARNLYLTPDFTPRRKVREWLLAINIGRTLSRERQLELYLNLAQWSPQAWGVVQGARAILGKSLDAITPSDAVLLALTLPAPTREFDYSLHPARRARIDRLPQQLWERGVLSEVQAAAVSARLTQWVAAKARTGSVDSGRQEMLAWTGSEQPWQGPNMPTLGCTDDARWVP